MFRICHKVIPVGTYTLDLLWVCSLSCFSFIISINAFITSLCSIVFGNEFSSCLSIGSVLRLRAAAITSLAENPRADGAMIFQLADQFLNKSKIQSETNTGEGLNHQICGQSQRETNTEGFISLACRRMHIIASIISDGNHARFFLQACQSRCLNNKAKSIIFVPKL